MPDVNKHVLPAMAIYLKPNREVQNVMLSTDNTQRPTLNYDSAMFNQAHSKKKLAFKARNRSIVPMRSS